MRSPLPTLRRRSAPDPLLALLAAGVAANAERKVDPAQSISVDDARRALTLAERANLDGLAAVGARALGFGDDVTDVGERTHLAVARAIFFTAATADVSRRLARGGVEHAFFKGAVSDELFFGGRGLRGTTDIDVLVGDLEATERALADVSTGPAFELARPWLGKPVRTMPVKILGQALAVDVHPKLLTPPLVDDSAAMLARAVRHPGRLPRFAIEDLVAYYAGNLVLDRFSGRLKLTVDVATLLLRPAELPCDWGVVVERAKHWRCSAALWALLWFVEERLHVPAPDGVLAALRPSAPRRALLRASVCGAAIPGAATRSLQTDSLVAGLEHFARYVPARAVDWLLDERRR